MATATNVNAIVLENNCIKVKGGARNMRVELTDTGLALFKAAKSGTQSVKKSDFIRYEGEEHQWDAFQSALEALYCNICVYVRKAAHQQRGMTNEEAKRAGENAEFALKNLTAIIGTRVSDRGVFKNALFVNAHMLAVFTGLVQGNRGAFVSMDAFAKKFVPMLFWVLAGNEWNEAEEIIKQATADQRRKKNAEKLEKAAKNPEHRSEESSTQPSEGLRTPNGYEVLLSANTQALNELTRLVAEENKEITRDDLRKVIEMLTIK